MRSDPDLLLVIGGRNDVGQDPDEVSVAIKRFYRDARKAFPRARIVAVAPLGDDTPVPEGLARIRSEVEESVEAVGGVYLDIGQPLAGKPELVRDDGVHPNGRGHKAIAEKIVDGLRDAGLPVRSGK